MESKERPPTALPECAGQLSGLGKAIGRLAMGKLGAILIGLTATPLLTRLYAPENFGTLAIISTLMTVLAPSATLSYVRAIPLARTISERRDLVALCLLVLLLTTGLVFIVAFSAASFLADAYGVPELAILLLVLPIMFLIAGAEQITAMLLNCQRKYSILAIRDVITAAGSALLGILAGVSFFGNCTKGLLIGAVAGMLLGVVFSITKAITPVMLGAESPVSTKRLRAAAVTHRDFPLIANWGTTLSPITQGLPVLLLGLFFPLQVVGFYAIANRLVTLPMTLFTAASSKAYYIESAEATVSGRSARNATLDLFRILSLLTTYPLLLSALLAPPLFELLLGSTWRTAGVYTQILTPWIAIAALASPLTGLYAIKQRHREFLFIQLLFLIGRSAAILLGGLVLGAAVPTLVLFSFVGVAMNVAILWRCTSLANISRRSAAAVLLPRLLETVAFLLPATFASFHYRSDRATLLLGAAATGGYLVLLVFRHRAMLQQAVSRFFRPLTPSLRYE